MLLCPPGFQADCARGCIAPEDFEVIGERIDFLEGVVDSTVQYGLDYLDVSQDYLDSCGCQSPIRAISYGTKVGLDCVYDKDD
eukprot:UN11080